MTGTVDVRVVTNWLVDIGYGFDFTTPDNPLPEPLRRPLAEAWRDRDGPGEPVDLYFDTLVSEGAWGICVDAVAPSRCDMSATGGLCDVCGARQS